MGSVHNAHHLHIHRMSISCFGPLTKIGDFKIWTCAKCFLAPMNFSSSALQK